MQATPAPSVPPRSPGPETSEETDSSYPEAPQNSKGPSAPFGALVGLFHRLQAERKHDRRKKLIHFWFKYWRSEVGDDLYPVLRLILPQKDRERAVYGLKETALAKSYIKLIPLNKKDPDAQRLLNWKKPSERNKSASGDFPTVVYEVVKKRSTVIDSTLRIDELNSFLDELSNSIGKQDTQAKILQRIYNRATPNEQSWIVRIILKDLIISVKENTVFSVFHPDAQDLYNTCSDLKKVAWTLWDSETRLNADDKTVQLFQPFAPMLCKRPTKTIEHSVKEMGGAEFYIEEKLDGERIQVHKRGNEYFYCSRKGKDYTHLYGKHVGTGNLTRYLAKALDERVDSIILDGEMLVWDPISERNLPFGTLKTAALDKSKKENNPRPCFKIFDMLYLNGQSLLDKSTSFRKKNLRNCLREEKGRIEFAIEYKGKTGKDVRTRMEQVMESKGEGLVIKHPKARYILNGRNSDWIKVKPEYMEGMGETVDVLVVAGKYGTGSRGGGVSTLICAVEDDRKQDEDGNTYYSTFVRIGSGLSFADYAWIRAKNWKVRDPKNTPTWLQMSKNAGKEDKGDLYLEPEDSFILKVKAAEIVSSDQYHLGYTMRFPRALSIRDDLDVSDCLTASEFFENLRSEKKRKMEDTTGVAKKRKTTVKKPEVLPIFRGPKMKDVKVLTDIFEGLTFVVMVDPKSRTKDADRLKLATTLHENGGALTQIAANHQPADLYVVYNGESIPYDLQQIIDKGVYDVVKPNWITDSVALGHKAPLKKKYFFHATIAREETDEYRDGDDPEVDLEDENMAEAESSREVFERQSRSQTAESEVKEEEDDSHADWFKVDGGEAQPQDDNRGNEPESESDDSDNADVAGEDVDDKGNDDEEDDDDWEQLESSAPSAKQEDVEMMGEDQAAMEYDQEHIFRHLCFYLDSPDNAVQEGMVVKKLKNEQAIIESFNKVKNLIEENGGRIVGLNEPKLTHVVFDKRDTSRRSELMNRTSRPRHRRLIITDWVSACVDEATLLNEEEFVP
ncbi:hypothetical protein GYMLUDRAFT_73906 [Collybiopsis luxurians FD-317 M1]|uniref:DNA ligase n=1 Tax=Collybiopsis luxurians FD-317 M1 TaxID=944289 RepID=A0A0D0B9U8_9AGAR|nr:hypothetical protein GYMLUDRAFT_73906 [Collybiopsis luxurians FD-317 M1]